MGVEHGAFCLGRCWFLMALLFVGGVMNLYWIVGLAVFVLLEKTIPAGHWLGSITGVGLMVWGVGCWSEPSCKGGNLMAWHVTGQMVSSVVAR